MPNRFGDIPKGLPHYHHTFLQTLSQGLARRIDGLSAQTLPQDIPLGLLISHHDLLQAMKEAVAGTGPLAAIGDVPPTLPREYRDFLQRLKDGFRQL